MLDSRAVRDEPYVPLRFLPASAAPFVAPRSGPLAALPWAILASTLHRVRRGECALLAINLSLIVYHGVPLSVGLMQAMISTLAILVMYALNDLYDAPVDSNNPKKDQTLIATWLAHRRVGVMLMIVLKIAILALAFATLGTAATAAVAAVMVVNVVYSTMLKGVAVADVVAVWLWGALYPVIVGAAPPLVVLVGLMTAICHLFQALDDRAPDAANGIQTTAVRSPALSRNVLVVLSLLLGLSLYGPLGPVGSVTAVAPVAIFFAVRDAGTGWLLTKAYFAVVWLAVLGSAGVAG